MSWATPWARPGAVRYAGPGVTDMPRTTSPAAPKPPVPRERSTPGDPRCPECRAAKRGYCPDHKSYHHVTHATAGVA